MTVGKWQPIEIHQQTLFEQFSSPLKALSDGTIPAVIFRKGFNPNHCISLVNRFYEKALLYDPRVDYGKAPKRVDIGTSLSKDGHDPDVFFRMPMQPEIYLELFSTDSTTRLNIYIEP